MDLEKVITKLNIEIEEKHGCGNSSFYFLSNGIYECIQYDNIILWDSENGSTTKKELEFGYKKNEDFYLYIKKVFNRKMKELSKLKL